MHIVFFASDKPRQENLANALGRGAAVCGDTLEIRRPSDFGKGELDCDVVATFGVAGASREIIEQSLEGGYHTLFFDKPHLRKRNDHFRVAVDGFMPRGLPCVDDGERFSGFGIDIAPQQEISGTGPVIFAGSSQKYMDFHGAGDATALAKKLVKRLNRLCPNRDVIYRPKPSWSGAKPIKGSIYSRPPRTIQDELKGAFALVTHGSNAAVDAVLAGVPVVILGDHPLSEIGVTKIEDISSLRPLPEKTRRKIISRLAWWQWSLREYGSGEAWKFLKNQILTNGK